MDIPLYEQGYAPRPPEEIQIEEVELAVYPDRFRIYIHVRVTPFQQRPNLLLTARTSDGTVASELNIIETMHNDMEFTMHLRGMKETAGDYTLTVELFYETRKPPQAQSVETFTVPSAEQPQAPDEHA